jgi:hypothetical protein
MAKSMLKLIGGLCLLIGISLLSSIFSINPVLVFSLMLIGFSVAILIF